MIGHCASSSTSNSLTISPLMKCSGPSLRRSLWLLSPHKMTAKISHRSFLPNSKFQSKKLRDAEKEGLLLFVHCMDSLILNLRPNFRIEHIHLLRGPPQNGRIRKLCEAIHAFRILQRHESTHRLLHLHISASSHKFENLGIAEKAG
jgi:hypothetical protein